ncbi:tRNA-dihydrouridine synthase family protein [uncultured Duncaniella sp.]|jgi:tRNA-dihydrouridine synthase|uniref:tRNA-dihydrouridine synthase family protein n=2 Tax=uncultured Duncaniella sp. TaxID=2768039 RepID=UPI0025AA283E|nr:tRNA-dihydrouridine synthase family protein [uncultured Duncaniella sp.]
MTLSSEFQFMGAPLQGFTEAPFRHYHSEIYGIQGHGLTYFTPFIRWERGEVRSRDLRDVTSELNSNHRLIPQIIFRDVNEFIALVNAVKAIGHRRVDLNMGCPFVPQVRKGRGAGMLVRSDVISEISRHVQSMTDMIFSIKMRLGVEKPTDWRDIIGIINDMPLSHLTIHPRTASQQYAGELHTDEFNRLLEQSTNPVIFNGDIESPSQIDAIRESHSELNGIMLGRGLLKRPSVIAEWYQQREWTHAERVSHLLDLHEAIFEHYSKTLTGGDAQILSKIKPLWEYLGTEFERKAIKKIIKANSISGYRIAVMQLA